MPEPDIRPLAERVKAYGCTSLIPIDQALSQPAQLDYLDLLPRRGDSPSQVAASGVAEHQGTALLYLVDACHKGSPETSGLASLRRQLANRSDPAWLGVVRPGSLEVHAIRFDGGSQGPLHVIDERDPRAPLFFQSLVHGTFGYRPTGTDYVFQRILDLLTKTIEAFVATERLEPLDVLSLAGRALFFRFLIDRQIVLPAERPDICPAADDLKDAFSNPQKAAQTSAWLDQTFNGDFLRLIDDSVPADDRAARQRAYLTFYRRAHSSTDGEVFSHLEAILRGWRHCGRQRYQLDLDWGDLDFAHVPVGVLSQVYESFSHRADARTARQTGVYYTPRTLARLMVNEVFAAAKDPASARVLDPACGAGIFLVLAFRRLVQERWLRDERRPATPVIRQILYQQLRGFDVSESALRLAALALYITAIEVNGAPRPPRTLKFPRTLRDEVLFHLGDTPTAAREKDAGLSTFTLGSLGERVPPRFERHFDIVLGNPPWTRLREEEAERGTERSPSANHTSRTATDVLGDAFTEAGRRALMARGLKDLAEDYANPDKDPDLPFLWRATQWAKDDGLIALALPARVFQRTTGIGARAWRAVLRCVSITGLINGADVRKTAVWDGMDLPFCLLFARNALPGRDHRFHYATLAYEPKLNRQGRFRIDYEAARTVSVERVEKQPWVLKTLSLGTWLDVELMENLTKAFPRTLAEAWSAWDPSGTRTGQGYNLSRDLKQKKKGTEFLGELLDFRPPETGFAIRFEELKTYFENHHTRTAQRPRTEALYQPPLVIVPQSPGEDGASARAYFSSQPLAFSQSYYGYSCAGHPDHDTLAALLYLLPQSTLFAYFCLMTSRRSGFDRQTFNKQEFDALPFPTLSALDHTVKATIRELARRVERDTAKPGDEIDSLLFRLYGLDDDAAQVARDTLFASVSYRKHDRAALDPPSQEHRDAFRAELLAMLQPYFEVCGQHVAVDEPAFEQDVWREPWFFLAISRDGEPLPVDTSLLRQAMDEANRRAASRILVRAPVERGLLLGLLNQRRWWTRSRARLCGQHILRHCLDAFGLSASA